MKLLAIDTATFQASVAICDGNHILAEVERVVTTHSDVLLELVDEAFSKAGLEIGDMEAVVCGKGPGSFTGVRIGLATAKGLCLAASKRLVCVPSLLALGSAVAEQNEEDLLAAALLDARRGEVYYALYRSGQRIQAEQAMTPEAVISDLNRGERVLLVGDGALKYQDRLLGGILGAKLAPEDCHQIHARYLLKDAEKRIVEGCEDALNDAEPLYVRGPDIR
ncbi:MAG: tRNA (adenosine(37)-N6)-threonylcarbamoyltransferase complex dimerization subunit type 1 TsaB [Pseudomonadota bacterium]